MNEEIKNLIIESRTKDLAMGKLANIAVQLSSYYATLSEEWGDIEVLRAGAWLTLREESTSDSMAEKKWLATEDGAKWTQLKIKLKYIEKTISSIKLRLKIAEGESFGKY